MAIAYSDTSNKNGIIQRAEIFTGLGDGGISGNATLLKQFTGMINSALGKVISMILDSQDAWDFDDTTILTTYPVATRSLTVNRDYKFSSALWSLIGVEGSAAASNAAIIPLKVKRVDVSYDGTTYFRCAPFDSSETNMGLGNDTITDARYDRSNPKYDLRSGSIWLYPAALTGDVSAGKLRIEFTREFTEFASSDTTKTIPIDNTFVPLIPMLAAQEYCMGNDMVRADRLLAQASDFEQRLRNSYGRKDQDAVIEMKAGYINYH